MIVVTQLLLEAINAPVPSYSSNVGLANALGMPYFVRSGPIARIMTLFGIWRSFNKEAADHHVVASLDEGARADIRQRRFSNGSCSRGDHTDSGAAQRDKRRRTTVEEVVFSY